MRKFIAYILLTIYLLASSGVSARVHYCGKKVASVFLQDFELFSKCKMAKSKTTKPCCSDKFFQIDTDDHDTISESFSFVTSTFVVPQIFNPIFSTSIYNRSVDFFSLKAPPLGLKQPIYLQNCNFRI